ncbi:MAG: tetratricopeptide repeat protein [Rhizobiaceae bacterium]|nr:tetratricopeptide repeat protein [Rhizobiaceae bacterium]
MARAKSRVETSGKDVARASFWARLRERLSLPGLEAWSTSVRGVFLNALFLVAVVVIVPVLISQFRRDEVVIEPIGVPESLAGQGFTADVAASRIWDGLQDTAAKARTAKESVVAIPDSRRVEFSFPDSGFSIESLVFHLRRLFNAYETRIAGEFVCADAACDRAGMRLRLRVIRDRVDLVDMPPLGTRGERDYFADAGARILSVLDPFVALAALAETQPLKATTLARRLIRSHHRDAKWAHNLVGLIRINENDLPAAIEEFRAALALDPDFLQPRANLGNALVRQGELDAAKAEFDRIFARESDNVWAVQGMAELAMARGDADGAVALLNRAADIDPVNPLYYAKAGKIELERGRKAEGEALLARALELDPGYLPAFAYLAAMHLGAGDNTAAERIYRDAADYSPDDADAQASHGRMVAILHRWPEAIARYERATQLEPGNADYWLELGRCLTSDGRPAEALKPLETASSLAPELADPQLALGNAFRDLGRKPEAIAAYRKFLELDTTGSPMRAIAERFIEILSG